MPMIRCEQRRRLSSVVFCLSFSGILFASTSASDDPLVCPEDETACADNSGCFSQGDVCDNIPICFDRTDERNCSKSCSDDEFYCEVDDECYALFYKCDGEMDCSDGSDEELCNNVTCTLKGEFMCVSDKTCIVGSLRCDGKIHCQDASDEKDCDEVPTDSSDCGSGFDCLKDGTQCIPVIKLCDGHKDCPKGEDEFDPSCTSNSTSSCDVNRGGCDHKCVENEHGHHCECDEGYKLSYDHKVCDDVDECEHHACSHECHNHDGGYECTCRTGYRLTSDLQGCLADGDEPELWVTNGSSLVQYKLRSLDRKITNLGGPLHGLTYGHRSGRIFWIDSLRKVIYWSNKDADGPPEILIDTMKDVPVALAYDWVHNNLYWADAGRHVKIEVVTLEHKWRAVIVAPPDVDHPKAMIVDPRSDEGYIYWAQGGINPVIRRAGLDGKDPETIVGFDVASVHALALDVVDNRLFWVDSKLNILESYGLHSNDRDILATFVEYPKLPTGVDVFEDYVYWADAEAKSVYKTIKFRTEGDAPKITTVLEHLTTPKTVEIYHKMKQPEGDSYCGENNGGCSHICLPSPQYVKFRCVCPMSLAKTLRFVQDPDNASSCLLSDAVPSSSSSSTLLPDNSTASALPISGLTPSSSMHNPTIFGSILPSRYQPPTTGGWKPSFNTAEGQGKDDDKAGKNADNMWLYIGIGGTAGLLIVVLLSFFGYKLYARHAAKNLHFDNPVFEQKPLRTSTRQADSRA